MYPTRLKDDENNLQIEYTKENCDGSGQVNNGYEETGDDQEASRDYNENVIVKSFKQLQVERF